MSVVVNRIRSSFYLDSVALMRVSAALKAHEGVEEAVLMIGTEPNLRILEDAGVLNADGRAAGPTDLVLAVRAVDETTAGRAFDAAEALLARRAPSTDAGEAAAPRSIAAAARQLEGADLALISTAGIFAVREAYAALGEGLNVMLFSDNVSLADERALKEQAAAAGLILMGPDCGTAYLGGTGLAFANVVNPGNVGIVAASGTGLQEAAVLLHRAGAGISHGIGVGGRDLDDAIGGISTLTALDWLAGDARTEHIMVLSKPPGPATAEKVLASAAATGKPTTLCLLGARDTGGLGTIKAAVEQVLGRAVTDFDPAKIVVRRTGGTRVAGLFTGGTLRTEAALVLAARGIDATGLVDLGDDVYTQGRPHPMLEPAVRRAPLAAALADAHNAVVLVDVVLGLGAHEDPAREVVEALAAAPPNRPPLVAYVCGTTLDPQDFGAQVRALEDAGALVAPSNADAAHLAATITSR